MAAFPEAWMEELHARSDIAAVIGDYVPLHPKGGRLWGLCPFHGEKTASFSVTQDKQLFYCFGCHAGGDVVHFIKSIEKIPYIEAVKFLAQRANLPLPEVLNDKQLQKEREVRERLLLANREAAVFYHSMLKKSSDSRYGHAMKYLQKRGISMQTMSSFGLGYAPDSWDELCTHLLGKGFTVEELVKAGLAQQKQQRTYDSLRNRLIFPIVAANKKVVGFGGRVLGDGQPKYWNTPETPVFNKRGNLYGLNMMRGRTLDSVVLVEGYMDTVSLHQAGIDNAVATLGTALTRQQARLIKRYAPEVNIAYDGDMAGQNATMRSLDILKAEGLLVRVIEFPDGQDPDDFIRVSGKKGFEARMRDALALNEFKLKHMAQSHDINTPDGREQYAREGSRFIATLSPIEQERYYPVLSRATNFSVQALRQEGQQNAQNREITAETRDRLSNNRNTRSKQNIPISKERLLAERSLVYVAAVNPELRKTALSQKSLLRLEAHIRFFEALEQAPPDIRISTLVADLTDEDAPLIAAALALSAAQDLAVLLKNAVASIRELQLLEEIAALQQQAELQDTPAAQRLECVAKIRDLSEELEKYQE